MCEPQVFGLRAGSSLAKMPLDGWVGGPRLGLDTSLIGKDETKTKAKQAKGKEVKNFDKLFQHQNYEI